MIRIARERVLALGTFAYCYRNGWGCDNEGGLHSRPVATLADVMELAHRHRVGGWWLLTAFVTLGLALDGLLAFKVGAYMDPDASIRREFWTLAHAHGTVLSLVHLGFASYLSVRPGFARAPLASTALFAAIALMPAGFLLGGAFPSEGDPGFGIWLVPLGGVSLLGGCILVALDATKTRLE